MAACPRRLILTRPITSTGVSFSIPAATFLPRSPNARTGTIAVCPYRSLAITGRMCSLYCPASCGEDSNRRWPCRPKTTLKVEHRMPPKLLIDNLAGSRLLKVQVTLDPQPELAPVVLQLVEGEDPHSSFQSRRSRRTRRISGSRGRTRWRTRCPPRSD